MICAPHVGITRENFDRFKNPKPWLLLGIISNWLEQTLKRVNQARIRKKGLCPRYNYGPQEDYLVESNHWPKAF
jgi:hypothetical protein